MLGLAIAGLLLSAASTTASVVEANKQSKIEEERAEQRSAIREVERQHRLEQQRREALIKQAKIRQAAQRQGSGESSGAIGASGALGTNLMSQVAIGSGRMSTSRSLAILF